MCRNSFERERPAGERGARPVLLAPGSWLLMLWSGVDSLRGARPWHHVTVHAKILLRPCASNMPSATSIVLQRITANVSERTAFSMIRAIIPGATTVSLRRLTFPSDVKKYTPRHATGYDPNAVMNCDIFYCRTSSSCGKGEAASYKNSGGTVNGSPKRNLNVVMVYNTP